MKAAWLPHHLRGSLRCSRPTRAFIAKPLKQRILLNASTKTFSTSSTSSAGIAAPEIKFPGSESRGGEGDYGDTIFYARLVPESPSYFTSQPTFTDDLLSLQTILRKYAALPVVKPGDAPRVAWQPLMTYRQAAGEAVKSAKYQKIIAILQRLNQIHHSVMPRAVKQALEKFKRDINPFVNAARPIKVDQFGRALGAGRRKTSTARAWVVEGTGEVLVNGKTLADTFGRIHDRESAVWALKATERLDKYNVWALVQGGGTTGQAEALTLAVAKALLAHEPALKPALRRGEPDTMHTYLNTLFNSSEGKKVLLLTHFLAGCITRDPRKVERKKPGHRKARKMPAWVKR
ncbi:hypothetical protein B7494_g1268 [Chlorociboria aeruginascens]|nr:hypothetical protein B7494_g1268 [Chlorociboria aeruginascens]